MIVGMVPETEYRITLQDYVHDPAFTYETSSSLGILQYMTPNGFSGTIIIEENSTGVYSSAFPPDVDYGELRIFNVKGQLVYSRGMSPIEAESFIWDGLNDDGQKCGASVYFLYYGNVKRKIVLR